MTEGEKPLTSKDSSARGSGAMEAPMPAVCDGAGSRSYTLHMSLSVRGALAWHRRELVRATKWITRDDGSRFTAEELRDALMDELAQGHEVIPMGSGCEGFDYKTGCPGHPSRTSPVQTASEPPAAPGPLADESLAKADEFSPGEGEGTS